MQLLKEAWALYAIHKLVCLPLQILIIHTKYSYFIGHYIPNKARVFLFQNWAASADFSCNWSLSAIRAMNSEFVFFPQGSHPLPCLFSAVIVRPAACRGFFRLFCPEGRSIRQCRHHHVSDEAREEAPPEILSAAIALPCRNRPVFIRDEIIQKQQRKNRDQKNQTDHNNAPFLFLRGNRRCSSLPDTSYARMHTLFRFTLILFEVPQAIQKPSMESKQIITKTLLFIGLKFTQ